MEINFEANEGCGEVATAAPSWSGLETAAGYIAH
jgi:hypothetical protein